MDLLIGLSYTLGIAALFGSLNAYYSGQKLHALYWVVTGLIVLILTGAFHARSYIVASENARISSANLANAANLKLLTFSAMPFRNKEDGPVVGWGLSAIFKNFGGMDAKDCRINYGYGEFPQPLPKDFTFPAGPSTDNAPSIEIAPGAEQPSEMKRFGNDIFDRVSSGKSTLVLGGQVRYRNGLPESEVHVTEFCVTVTVRGDVNYFKPGGQQDPFEYIACTGHNRSR